jgi:hypothetical protein
VVPQGQRVDAATQERRKDEMASQAHGLTGLTRGEDPCGSLMLREHLEEMKREDLGSLTSSEMIVQMVRDH